MACHRWLYEDIGGFDGTRDEYGSDDWEFAARAFNAGAVLVHDPAAVGWHDEPDWADRDGRLDAKNRQSLWLARSVAEPLDPRARVAGERRHRRARGRTSATPPSGQIVATVDSVLAAVPDAVVLVPTDLPAAAAAHVAHDPRVRSGREATWSSASSSARVHDRPARAGDLGQPTGCGRRSRSSGPAAWASWRSPIVAASWRRCGAVGPSPASSGPRRHGVDACAALDVLFGRRSADAGELGLSPLDRDVDLAGLLAGWWRP